MICIKIPKTRYYNEDTKEFYYLPEVVLKLEHSLMSVRRWESRWKKSFFEAIGGSMTGKERIDYVRCMCLDQMVDENVFKRLTRKNMDDIVAYINDPMTATTIKESNQGGTKRIITAELLYYSMIEYGIPFECEKWHLNQLLTLIKVCGTKNTPRKKQTSAEIAAMYSAISASRRKRTGSKG